LNGRKLSRGRRPAAARINTLRKAFHLRDSALRAKRAQKAYRASRQLAVEKKSRPTLQEPANGSRVPALSGITLFRGVAAVSGEAVASEYASA
jgi:hypothetical protein